MKRVWYTKHSSRIVPNTLLFHGFTDLTDLIRVWQGYFKLFSVMFR